MGFDALLPLVKDSSTGWATVKTAKEAIQQDFKILLLTSPGERPMNPDFGVGLKRFLFEQLNRQTLGAVETKIRKQTSKYLPFIKINDISFSSASSSATNTVITDMDQNAVSITISYSFGRGFYDQITVST